MDLLSAKNMVAHKYFREKWKTLSPAEQLKHFDEVAELYCKSNNAGVNKMSFPVKLHLCQCDNSKSVEVDLCTECFGVFHAVK